jgi:type 1 glutamine amidotransferase
MKHSLCPYLFKLSMVFGLAFVQLSAHAADKKNIVLIAGKQSHGPGAHEHNAGVQLFAKCLRAAVPDLVDVKVHLNAEWPAEEEIKSADTILIYADGFTMHPALQWDHLQQLSAEMKRGCGFMALHWATEVPKNKGEAEFLDWMGGYCDPIWSVNPHWLANFTTLPQHPITSGVHPFSTTDEWYFHMRFRKGMASVKPILTAVPPDSTMSRPDGVRSGNPDVRKDVANKVPQHVAWAAERTGGGRGFGFTGGHFHKGWANNDQRKLVLNAILWTAKAAVPANGVESLVTEEDLKQNLDPKPAPKAQVPLPKP